MPRSVVRRANFSGGLLDESLRSDPQKAIYEAGLAEGSNLRILNGGGVKRRGASWLRAILANGKAIGTEYTTPAGAVLIFVFSHARLDIYDTGGNLIGTVTSCPWGSSIIDEMQFDSIDEGMVVTHTTFWPRLITISGTTVTIDEFEFDNAPGGGPAQPYYRYADKGITLQPSATSGSITLTASDDVFEVGHEGTYFRILGCEILIDTVNSSTSADGTVVTSLPATVTVNVADPTGYLVDGEVKGLDSGAEGILTNVSGSTLTVVYKKGLTGFNSDEQLVADGGAQSTITSGPTPTTNAAVVDWDEQAFSSVRGYPGGCRNHRGRLYLYDMRDLPRGIAASAASFPRYFQIGANDGDAFFELVPNLKGQRVRHVVSATQGIVLTDKATYFMPEYGNQVITPSTVDFRLIAEIGASQIHPVPTEQGFAYAEEGTNRIIGILPSGNVQAPWECDDISAFWTELITGPRSLACDVAITSRPERYAYVINDDGTMACVKYSDPNSQVPIGWTPWSMRNAAIRSTFSAGGKLYSIVQRIIGNDNDVWTLEQFDESLYVDCAVEFTSGSDLLVNHADSTVSVMSDGHWYRGAFALDDTGAFGDDFDLDTGGYIAGFDMTCDFKPTPPVPDHPAYRHGQRIGIPEAFLHVKDTGAYYFDGQLSPAYRMGESQDIAPPLRTEASKWKVIGRDTDGPPVSQSFPGPLQILGLNMEVSF
jgi:hypothetical protein